MRRLGLIIALALVFGVVGCRGSDPDPARAPESKPAASVSVAPADGSNPKSQSTQASEEPSLISSVDRNALARALAPDAVPQKIALRQSLAGVVGSYQLRSTREVFELCVGLYPTIAQARAALSRTMPSVARMASSGDECFFSGQHCHMRVKNLVVLFAPPRWIQEDQHRAIAEGLFAAIQEEGVIQGGDAISLPQVDIVKLDESATLPLLVYGCAEPGVMHPTGVTALESGLYSYSMDQRLGDPEPVLRLMRASGEVLELRLSQIPQDKRGPWRPDAPRLDEKREAQLILSLRARAGSPTEQQSWMLELRKHARVGLVAFYQELLQSDRPTSIKKHALAALVVVQGSDGLAEYRRCARDPEQPQLIRRDSLRQVGQHGTPDDIAWLERLHAGDDEVLGKAAAAALRQIQARSERPRG